MISPLVFRPRQGRVKNACGPVLSRAMVYDMKHPGSGNTESPGPKNFENLKRSV
jgi:hypothetical protein